MPQPSSVQSINATVPIRIAPQQKEAATAPPTGAVDVAIQQSTTVFGATLIVPAGSSCRACLPAAHGMDPAKATVLTLDGKAVGSPEAEGRMLCFGEDLGPGRHVLGRKGPGGGPAYR